MTGVKNTVATLALETLLNLPPLDLYIKATAFNTSFNIQVNGCWQPLLEKGHTTVQNLIRTDEMLMPSDQMKLVLMLDDEFEWLIPEREEWLGEGRSYPRSDGITCYTDVSKKDCLSGAGYYCEYLKLNRKKHSNRFHRHRSPSRTVCNFSTAWQRSFEEMHRQDNLHLLRQPIRYRSRRFYSREI